MAQYLSGISNFLYYELKSNGLNIFKSITKYSDAIIVQNRIEMDFIETEVGTLSWVPLLLKFTLMHLYQYSVQTS